MRTLVIGTLGALALAAGVVGAAPSASALGGCGPNGHRGPYGHCRWGGQNQAWCVRHTGHGLTPGPHGTSWCER